MYILGNIKDGKIEVQKFFQNDVLKNEGKLVEIKVVASTRSLQQNRYLWGIVYRLVSEYTGYTSEETHEVFKKKFLTYEKNGHKFTRSTTELNTTEFGEYLDKVVNYAGSELGIVIPDPDPA